jgi:hypothetical protein
LNVFIVYLLYISIYFNVFKCILMPLKVFEYIY